MQQDAVSQIKQIIEQSQLVEQLVRYNTIDALMSLLFSLVCLITLSAVWRLALRLSRTRESYPEEHNDVRVFISLAGGLFVFVFTTIATCAAQTLVQLHAAPVATVLNRLLAHLKG